MDRLPLPLQQQQQWEALTPTQQQEVIQREHLQQPQFATMLAPGTESSGGMDNGQMQIQHILQQQQHAQHSIQQQLLQQQRQREDLIQRQRRPQQLSQNQAQDERVQMQQMHQHVLSQQDPNTLSQIAFVAPGGGVAFMVAGGNGVNVGTQVPHNPHVTAIATTSGGAQMVVVPQGVAPGIGTHIQQAPPQYSAAMVSNLMMATAPLAVPPPSVDALPSQHLVGHGINPTDPQNAVAPQGTVQQQGNHRMVAAAQQTAQGLLHGQLQAASGAATAPFTPHREDFGVEGNVAANSVGAAEGQVDARVAIEVGDTAAGMSSAASGIPGLTPSMTDIMAEVLKSRGVHLDPPLQSDGDGETNEEVELVGVTPAPTSSLFSQQLSDGRDTEDEPPTMDEPLQLSNPSHQSNPAHPSYNPQPSTHSQEQPPLSRIGGAFAPIAPQGPTGSGAVTLPPTVGQQHPAFLESRQKSSLGKAENSLSAEEQQKLLLLKKLHITRAQQEPLQRVSRGETGNAIVDASPQLPDVVIPFTQSSAETTPQQHHVEIAEINSEKQISMNVDSNYGADTDEGNDHHTEIDETSKAQHREYALNRLGKALTVGIQIAVINLSQRGLTADDAATLAAAVAQCPQLAVLKLSYNQFGDKGAAILANAIGNAKDSGGPVLIHQQGVNRPRKGIHHGSLEILDLGFNRVGDVGCSALARAVVAGNFVLRTLYLSGNTVGMAGGAALADAIEREGSGLERLHLTANKIGSHGIQLLLRAIAQNDQKVGSSGRSTGDAAPTPMMMSTAMDFKNAPDSGCAPTGLPPSIHEQSKVFTRPGSESGGHRAMRELFLGGTNMGSAGCLAVSNMILTSTSLRVLSLCDNGLRDEDLALLSHALHQALKRRMAPPIPLETLELSFNELTCVGVESLMNAVWGSPDLRELRLDNNNVRDRGAQLAALTLATLKNLQVLDVGFNVISSEGIRALMKSLTEDGSLKSLSLSGNALDVNSCKAISYALAHNASLSAFYVDNCSMGYAAQRHVTAGIVSNSSSALRIVTGIRIGAIASTLGLPSELIGWSNERVLKFFRMMWERRRQGESSDGGMETDIPLRRIVGPSDPASVVAAAKRMMAAYDDDNSILDATEDEDPDVREVSKTSPYVPDNALILEREPLRGKLSVPVFSDEPVMDPDPLHMSMKQGIRRGGRRSSLDHKVGPVTSGKKRKKPRSPSTPEEEPVPSAPVLSPRRVARNLEWLKQNISALSEVSKFPFNEAELWQHEQFYSSPPETTSSRGNEAEEKSRPRVDGDSVTGNDGREMFYREIAPSPEGSTSSVASTSGGITRKLSFRYLGDSSVAMAAEAAAAVAAPPAAAPTTVGPDGRRRLVPINESDSSSGEDLAAGVEKSAREDEERVSKRRRSPRNRIAHFPRIKQKLQLMKLRSEPYQALVLLRRLRYVETIMFRDRNIYAELIESGERGDGKNSDNTDQRPRASGVEFDIPEGMEEGAGDLPTTVDVEAILLDML